MKASLSEEQKARIETNKKAALEKLLQRQESKAAPSGLEEQQGRPEVQQSSKGDLPASVDLPQRRPEECQQSSKRVLPAYVENTRAQKGKRRALPGSITGQSTLQRLVFSKEIVYVQRADETSSAVERLLKSSECSSAKSSAGADLLSLGFDIEWFVTFEKGVAPRKVATIQLCSVDCCVVFQTSNFDTLPAGLIKLLQDPLVLKVGVGAGRDAIKVQCDLGVEMHGVVNLEDLAAGKEYDRSLSGGASLASLCASVLGRQLDKPPHLRLSNWELPLTWAQLDYAALDAYAGLRCHQALLLLPAIIKPRCPPPQTPDVPLAGENGGGGSESRHHVTSPSSSSSYSSLTAPLSSVEAVLVPRRPPLTHLAPFKLFCWDMWALQRWSIAQVADTRHIKPETVTSYVCDAIEAGYEYRWDELGVPKDVEAHVRAAAAKAVLSNKLATEEEAQKESCGATTAGSETEKELTAPSEALNCPSQEQALIKTKAVREHLDPDLGVQYWMIRAVLLHIHRTQSAED